MRAAFRSRCSGSAQGPLPEDRSREVWRLLCEHWDVFRGTAVRYWLEAELAELFGVSVRPSRRTADAVYDQIAARLRDDAYRPRALYERFGVEVLATTDDPCGRPRRARGARRRPDLDGARDPDVPARSLPRAGPARLARRRRPSRRVRPASTPATTPGYLQALEQRRRHFLAHGATSADHSHDDVRTDPLEPVAARPHLPGGARRRGDRGRGDRLPPAHAARDGADVERGRPGDDAPPRRAPQPSRAHAAARFGPDTGHDIPIARRAHRRAAPAARALRHAAGLPPRGLHARRDRLVARARAAGGLLSVGLRRCAVVVPRRPRCDPAVPRRGQRDRRLLAHAPASSTTRARSARSPRGTTCRGGSTPGSWRNSSPSTASTRTRPPRRPSTSSRPGRRPCSSCELPRVVPRRRGRAGGGARSARAPGARELLPGPSGLVHRPRPGRRRVGHRSLHRPQAWADRRAHRAGRPLHARHPRRGRRPIRRARQPLERLRRERP